MTHSLSLFSAGLLTGLEAAGYGFATIGMQAFPTSDSRLPTVIICAGLSVAATAEISLL